MMSKENIEILLDDLQSKYMVAYERGIHSETEAETWGQIQILEWILEDRETFDPNTWCN